MITMGIEGRKWDIFVAAVDAFAERGFDGVSIKEIAKSSGIQASTIYYHFKSKEDLLNTIFDYDKFAYNLTLPILEQAVLDAGDLSKHPFEPLYKIHCQPDPQTRLLRSKILVIAMSMLRNNSRADELVMHDIIETLRNYTSRILHRLIELERIEPLDVDIFCEVQACHTIGAIVRGMTSHPVPDQAWLNCVHFLFSMIKVREEHPVFMLHTDYYYAVHHL